MTREEKMWEAVEQEHGGLSRREALVTLTAMEWADKTMIDKACKCYCDDICDKGRCGMCFHKHDGKGQVKNTFRYNECNELKLIRKVIEE